MNRLRNGLSIFFLADISLAGRVALMYMVIQTGTLQADIPRQLPAAAPYLVKLAEQLNKEERQMLDTLIGTHHKINSITAKEYFILGFRLGVRLMAECMDEDDGELIDRGVSTSGKEKGQWRRKYSQTK